MPTQDIQYKRTLYFNRVTEYGNAKRTNGDAELAKSAATQAGYDYIQALIGWHNQQSGPSIDGLGEPMILEYRIGTPIPNEQPMIMRFAVGNVYVNDPVPSPYETDDEIWQKVVEEAPHCYIDEWDDECQALYDRLDEAMSGGVCPTPDPLYWFGSTGEIISDALYSLNGQIYDPSPLGTHAPAVTNDSVVFGLSRLGDNSYQNLPRTTQPDRIVIVIQPTDNQFQLDMWDSLGIEVRQAWGRVNDIYSPWDGASFGNFTFTRSDLESMSGGSLSSNRCYRLEIPADTWNYIDAGYVSAIIFQAGYAHFYLRDVEFYSNGERFIPQRDDDIIAQA